MTFSEKLKMTALGVLKFSNVQLSKRNGNNVEIERGMKRQRNQSAEKGIFGAHFIRQSLTTTRRTRRKHTSGIFFHKT